MVFARTDAIYWADGGDFRHRPYLGRVLGQPLADAFGAQVGRLDDQAGVFVEQCPPSDQDRIHAGA